MAERFASISEDELCEKIIKQLLNLVLAWYHELSKPRVCVIWHFVAHGAFNTDLGFDNSWCHAQPHPIIVYCTLQMNYNIIQPRPQGASLFESEKVAKSPWIILFKKPETNW